MGVATGATGVWAAAATATKARTAAEACILKVVLVVWVLRKGFEEIWIGFESKTRDFNDCSC